MVHISSDKASAWLESDGSRESGCQSRDPIVVATAGNKGTCVFSVSVLDVSTHLRLLLSALLCKWSMPICRSDTTMGNGVRSPSVFSTTFGSLRSIE